MKEVIWNIIWKETMQFLKFKNKIRASIARHFSDHSSSVQVVKSAYLKKYLSTVYGRVH